MQLSQIHVDVNRTHTETHARTHTTEGKEKAEGEDKENSVISFFNPVGCCSVKIPLRTLNSHNSPLHVTGKKYQTTKKIVPTESFEQSKIEKYSYKIQYMNLKKVWRKYLSDKSKKKKNIW